MKDTIKVSWYIILTTMVLWMFVVEATKVFAHGNGQCITDAAGDVFLSDDSYVKIDSHLSVDELKAKNDGGKYKYEHGHKNQYYDKHDNKTTLSTSFFDKDGGLDKDEFYVDCPTAPQPPAPATVTRTPRTPARSTVSQQLYYPGIVREPEVEVAPQCEEIELQVFLWWGETLLAPPVLPAGVETFADLWDAWGLSIEKGNKIKILVGNRNAYDDVSAEDEPFTPNQGLVIEQTIGNLLNLKGCPVKNSQKILIQKGYNLVGFPRGS